MFRRRTDLTTLKTKVENYLSVYKIDDQTGNTLKSPTRSVEIGINDQMEQI